MMKKVSKCSSNKVCLVTFVIIGFLVVAGLASRAAAVPQWDVDFDGMTVDQAPDVEIAVAGVVNTKPTALTPASSTILVKSSYSSGGASLSSTPVVVSGSGWANFALEGHADDYEVGVDYKVEFDLLIPSSAPADSGVFCVNFFREGSSALLGGMTLHTTSMKAILTSLDTNNPSEQSNFINVWSVDTVMHVELAIDGDSGVLAAWINGSLIGTIQLAPDAEYQGVKTVQFANGTGASPVEWAVDNISSSTVVDFQGNPDSFPAWEVDFNDMTVDQAPETATAIAGIYNTKPTELVPDGSTILVKSSYTAGSATLSENPVVVSGTGWAKIEFTSHIDDYEVGNDFKVEFDLLIPSSAPVNLGVCGVYLYRNGSGSALGYLVFQTTDMRAMLGSLDSVNPATNHAINHVWSTETVMHVAFGIDGDTGKLGAWIDGELIGVTELAPDPEYHGVRTIVIGNGTASAPVEWAVDNIVTSNASIELDDRIPLWDVDFADDVAGQAPALAVAQPGVYNTRPTAIELVASTSILVQDSFTSGSASLDNKPVVFTDNGAICTLKFDGDMADYETPMGYKVGFDMVISSAGITGATCCSIDLYNANSSTYPIATAAFNRSDMRVTMLSWNRPTVYSDNFFHVWSLDTVLHCILLVDAENDEVTFWINNEFVGSIQLAPIEANQGVLSMSISSNSAAEVTFAVDNIRSVLAYKYLDCAEVWKNGQGLAADLNRDCHVDMFDLSMFVGQWLDSTLN
ncbi:MAG: hypothetical protein ABIG61_03175 [Planctomycetota bacterium]